MSSYTHTSSFTVTHAKYLASKVASDLRQIQRLYGRPVDSEIGDYLLELAILLAGGYLDTVTYGFKTNGNWLLAVRYAVNSDGNLVADNRPGGIFATADVSRGKWHSYLAYSDAWTDLTSMQREAVKSTVPVQRSYGDEPGTGAGYWVEQDRSYSSGGVGVVRKTFRPWP
jgi:hypothetical protein